MSSVAPREPRARVSAPASASTRTTSACPPTLPDDRRVAVVVPGAEVGSGGGEHGDGPGRIPVDRQRQRGPTLGVRQFDARPAAQQFLEHLGRSKPRGGVQRREAPPRVHVVDVARVVGQVQAAQVAVRRGPDPLGRPLDPAVRHRPCQPRGGRASRSAKVASSTLRTATSTSVKRIATSPTGETTGGVPTRRGPRARVPRAGRGRHPPTGSPGRAAGARSRRRRSAGSRARGSTGARARRRCRAPRRCGRGPLRAARPGRPRRGRGARRGRRRTARHVG